MGKSSIPKGVIKDIVIVAVGVLVIWIGLQLVFGTQNPFYVVSSGSMIPVLEVYDVLVVQGNDPFESVEIGDIIVFNRPSGHDRVIVHRVVSIIDEDPLTIRTKGDANPASIPGTDFPITEEEFIGKVAYVVPDVGYITRILTPPINYIIIAIIIGIMVFKQFSKKKSNDKSEEKTDLYKNWSDSTSEKNTDLEDAPSFEDLDKIPKDDEYREENTNETTQEATEENTEPTTEINDESKSEEKSEDSEKKD